MRTTRSNGIAATSKAQEATGTTHMNTQARLGVPPAAAADDGSDTASYSLYKRGFSSLLSVLHRRLDNVRRAGREVNVAEGWWPGAGDSGDSSASAFVERQLAGAGEAIAEAGALDKRNRARFYSEGQQRVAYAEDAMDIAWNRICRFLGVEVPDEGEPFWARRVDRLIDASRQAAETAKPDKVVEVSKNDGTH